ncbi:MAG: endonuclease NucS [Desulfurococcaceae archaeon]
MKSEILVEPELEDVLQFIRRALLEKSTVVIIGECSVDYEGRGSSRLERGERIVVIKQDGAMLVHRPTGYSPVNWQPSTSVIEVTYKPEVGLLLHGVRDSPREYLTITFSKVYYAIARKLVDKAEFVMYVDENVMRDTIAENPWIIEEGLEVLEVEKPVGDGYVDIYAMDKHKRRVLIELKRVTATREAVLQLYKYVEAYRREHGVTPRGILVAPSFSPTALETLHRLGLEYRYVDLRKIWELVKKKQVKRAKPLDEFLRKQG